MLHAIRRAVLLAVVAASYASLSNRGLAVDLNINVDINGGHAGGNVSGTFSGVGPGGGGTWNSLTILDLSAGTGVNRTFTGQTINDPGNPSPPNYDTQVSGPFVHTDGSTASGLTITTASFNSADDNRAGSNALLDDYLVQNNNTGAASLAISGLTGSFYDVYVFGSNDGGNAGGTFTVNGSAAQSTTGAPFGATPPLVLGRDYVEFTGVVPSSGSITITAANGGTLGFVGVLNGFQLVAVPEPGAFSLLAVGLAVVAGLGCLSRKTRLVSAPVVLSSSQKSPARRQA